MISKQISVNGNEYKITLTDQIINYVISLKNLYNTAYEDPESFEQVSSEISTTINEISGAIDPVAADGDLDGLIQEIISAVDSRTAATEQELLRSTRK